MLNKIEFFETPYKGYYASKSGDIFSVKTKKCLTPKIDKDGYCEYALTLDSKIKFVRGHRILAETFLPNPDGKETVNHKNGDKSDNRVENLEWATYSENNHHRFDVLHCYKPVKWLFTCEYKNKIISNLSKKDCEKHGISGRYLDCIMSNTINTYFMYIEKTEHNFLTYWNGQIYKIYKTAKEVSNDLGIKLNCVYTRAKRHKAVEYISRDYKITFKEIKTKKV